MTEYRVKWAVVQSCSGSLCKRVRMCIAERRVTLFFGISFWWPVGEWRNLEDEAIRDAEGDAYLRSPLPDDKIMRIV